MARTSLVSITTWVKVYVWVSVLVCLVGFSNGLVITNPCCSEFPHRVALFGAILPSKDEESVDYGSGLTVSSVEGFLKDTPTDDPIFCANHEVTHVHKDYFKDKIALIPRGYCSFAKKVYLAEAYGAKAVIVYQSSVGPRTSETMLTGMAADDKYAPRVSIPSAFISHSTWVSLRELSNGSGLYAVLNATSAVGNHGVSTIPMMWSSIVFLFRVFLIIWTFLGSVFFYNWVEAKCRKRQRYGVVRNLPNCKFSELSGYAGEGAAARGQQRKKKKTYVEVDQEESAPKSLESDEETDKMNEEEEVMVEISLQYAKVNESDTGFSCIECENCVICLCDYEDDDTVTILPCKHVYHKACIEPWLISKSALCPMCKQSILPCGDSRSLNEINDSENANNFAQNSEEDQRRTSLGLTLGMFMVIVLSLSFTMFDQST